VPDPESPGAVPRVLLGSPELTQILFPGHRLRLTRDEVESYYLRRKPSFSWDDARESVPQARSVAISSALMFCASTFGKLSSTLMPFGSIRNN
jgi:hypothetical protein